MKERVNDFKNIRDLKGLEAKERYDGPICRGDIFLIELDAIDFENDRDSIQRGTRPAIVIQNNVGNTNSPTIIIAAITSKSKKSLPTHVNIMIEVPSTILCEQLFTIDKSKIVKKITHLQSKYYDKLNKALMVSIALFPHNNIDTSKIVVNCENLKNYPVITAAINHINNIKFMIGEINDLILSINDTSSVSVDGNVTDDIIEKLNIELVKLTKEKLNDKLKSLSLMIGAETDNDSCSDQERFLSDENIVEYYKRHTANETSEYFGISLKAVHKAASKQGYKKYKR